MRRTRWLRGDREEPGAQQPVRSSLVSVMGLASAAVVGGGVYMGDALVLTCAHVVNDSLGRNSFEQRSPDDTVVRVAFPGAAEPHRAYAAEVVSWIPARHPSSEARPARRGDRTWAGDLALLRLVDAPPADVRAVRWSAMTEGQKVRAWFGGGQQFTYADGFVRLCDTAIAYVDSALVGAAIGPGYSGGPLWCEEEEASVGIVLGVIEPAPGDFSAGQVVRRTITVPWQAIDKELDRAYFRRPAEDAPPRPSTPAVHPAARHAIATVVAEALADPAVRAAHASRLAEELDLDVAPDATAGVDEIVDVLVSRPRAVAALCESMRQSAPDAALQLLYIGKMALIPGMLSPSEHQWLMELLPPQAAARLAEAAKAALPDSTFFEELTDPPERLLDEHERLLRLIEKLEEFWGDSAPVPDNTPRVPALLRAVEYLAAVCEEPTAGGLRGWSESVARRLGVAQAALRERRDDAGSWAQGERSATHRQPRLTVELTRVTHGTPATFRCAAWYTSGREDETDRRVLADDEARTPAAITRVLHDILKREGAVATSAKVPVIEFLMEADDLDEPVDAWHNEPADGEVPVVLGAEYTVHLRCPHLRRDADQQRSWRSRWAHLERGKLVRLDLRHSTVLQVYGLLKADLDASRVILACDVQHRERLRAVCLLLGVPVVLWDRAKPSASRNDQVTALMLNGPIRGLPLRVRQHRARALAETSPDTLAPALVWDDASQLPPTFRWSGPTGQEPIR
ncbi:trypsin-like peptidase domain-containing protein [Streptomyces spiralis]|uniref:VMAP-C domain-containing protein n=1 Tax=Streptomyces spiralis TaxID=66376 RepID=UPI0036A597A6